jgi:hypothetical protein
MKYANKNSIGLPADDNCSVGLPDADSNPVNLPVITTHAQSAPQSISVSRLHGPGPSTQEIFENMVAEYPHHEKLKIMKYLLIAYQSIT